MGRSVEEMSQARVLVFTATFNEARNIEEWLQGVTRNHPQADILVVDDNSPDGTGDIVRQWADRNPRIRLLSRPSKLGLSSAHLLAMHHALDENYDVLVTMDADGSHQPNQIVRVLDGLESAQFSIGTRSRGGTHQATALRRLLSHSANGLARFMLPMGLTEYTTSFRAFSRPALRAALDRQYTSGGYAFFIECLEGLHQRGISMSERPIDFLDRQGGVSKIPKNQILVSARALTHLSWLRIRSQRGR